MHFCSQNEHSNENPYDRYKKLTLNGFLSWQATQNKF